MLGSKKQNGEVDQGHIERTKYRQYCRQHWSLPTTRKTPQNQIANVNQPENKCRSQAHIPCPPDPHTGRAHNGPVTNTTVQKTTPTSAAATATASALALRRNK